MAEVTPHVPSPRAALLGKLLWFWHNCRHVFTPWDAISTDTSFSHTNVNTFNVVFMRTCTACAKQEHQKFKGQVFVVDTAPVIAAAMRIETIRAQLNSQRKVTDAEEDTSGS